MGVVALNIASRRRDLRLYRGESRIGLGVTGYISSSSSLSITMKFCPDRGVPGDCLLTVDTGPPVEEFVLVDRLAVSKGETPDLDDDDFAFVDSRDLLVVYSGLCLCRRLL